MLALKPCRSLLVWLLRPVEYSSKLPNSEGSPSHILLPFQRRNAILEACDRTPLHLIFTRKRNGMALEDFQRMVNALRNPGDDGVPDTIFDDLTAEYTTAFDGYTEHTRSKDAEIQHLNGEVSRLKSANYDLLTRVSTEREPIDIDGPDDADDDAPTIGSLFKRK